MHYAALFLDFENIYYYLTNNLADGGHSADLILRMVEALRKQLAKENGESVIVSHAYADFDRANNVELSGLYLLGVEPHHVTGTDHKNAADMKLCIDAMEMLYTRKEIGTFVVISGDRDYIPVIQHLKKNARMVRAVAFPENVSGDLKLNVGEEFFINAHSLLPENTVWRKPASVALVPPAAVATPVREVAKPLVAAKPVSVRSAFSEELPVDDANCLRALQVMLSHFKGRAEIWMGPLLHKLRADMPQLADLDRKLLVTRLEGAGAIRVERRNGEAQQYSVVLVNWNHASVRDSAA